MKTSGRVAWTAAPETVAWTTAGLAVDELMETLAWPLASVTALGVTIPAVEEKLIIAPTCGMPPDR